MAFCYLRSKSTPVTVDSHPPHLPPATMMTDSERIHALEAQTLIMKQKLEALLLVMYEQGKVVDELATLVQDLSGANASGVAVIKYVN